MKNIKNSCLTTWVLVLCFNLSACSRSSESPALTTLTVAESPFSNTLFYTGMVQPSKTMVVTSPAEGVVMETSFQYGEPVCANQLLFKLSSAKFLSDYKSALMQYIKAKSEFNDNKAQLSESKFLHKNLLISDDAFKMKQSGYYAAQLALLQAKDTLQSLLQQLDIKNFNLYKLTIADIDKITDALHMEMASESLRILSPTSGIALSSSKSEEESKKILKGDVVKQGDVLAVIGDMSGLTVRIKVNEITINQIKVAQKVKVTGIAFSDVLSGEIKQIDRQGEPSSSGVPTFSVMVMVPLLTPEQQKRIHVGMSAKVEIKVDEGAQIAIPMSAVFEKNGVFYVKLYDAKTKKGREQLIETGKTTNDSVEILAGLKSGDQIVLPH